MELKSAVVSMWLPVTRPNFYSSTTNSDLFDPEVPGRWRAQAVDREPELPDSPLQDPVVRLRVTVLRRVLEVLPRTFGYDEGGVCTESAQSDLVARPTAVRMTLRPTEEYDGPLAPVSLRRRANNAFISAGVREVTFDVDELGFYVWTAAWAGASSEATVIAALRSHIRQVVGGDFALHRENPERSQDGAKAAQWYNDADERDPVKVRPRGILTFTQLNTIFEGLFNETLSPAVFFENYGLLAQWLDKHDRDQVEFRDLAGVADLFMVDVDARQAAGRIATLTHFLARTSRETLQKLTWSLESVRRALLDEMLGKLHRHTDLSQLRLSKSEWTPQLAAGATETQLRGYVMLVGAKLPIVTTVKRVAASTVEQLSPVDPSAAQAMVELERHVADWDALLRTLTENLHGLERAIEHSWMERLLYEQEQARGQQEAMAEIERSRDNRSPNITTDTAINSLALFLAIVGTLWAVLTTEPGGTAQDASDWDPVLTVLPILGVGAAFYLLAVGALRLFRWRRERAQVRSMYNYEFAFRLDRDVIPERTAVNRERQRAVPIPNDVLRQFTMARYGGERLERVSADEMLVKHHCNVAFTVGLFARARFEAVNEIVVQRGAAGTMQYTLRGTRLFGDSPRPLTSREVVTLITLVLDETAATVVDGPFDSGEVINLALPLYGIV